MLHTQFSCLASEAQRQFWYFEHEISKSNGWICKLILNFSHFLPSFFFSFLIFVLVFSIFWFMIFRYGGTFLIVFVGSFPYFFFLVVFLFLSVSLSLFVNFYRYIFYIGRLFRSRWRSACSWSRIREIGKRKCGAWVVSHQFKYTNSRYYFDFNETSHTPRIQSRYVPSHIDAHLWLTVLSFLLT